MQSSNFISQIRSCLNTALSSDFTGKRKSRRQRSASKVESRFFVEVNTLEDRILLAADLGDAPLPYPVTLAENGAQHTTTGPTLGATRDSEANGVHSATANADGPDEDGVTFGSIQVGQLDATVSVNVQSAPSGARLDAWIDWNQDGSWGGTFEQIAANVAVVNGNNAIEFDVPSWAVEGTTFGRFRLSTIGSLGLTGLASNGEVEDYAVTVTPSDETLGEFSQLMPAFGGGTTFRAPISVSAADFDGDGDMDLIGAFASGANKLAWGENDGTERFLPHVIPSPNSDIRSMAIADLDGDGDVDVLTAQPGSNVWYENDGLGTFVQRTLDNSGGPSITAADIDLDGDMDIISGPAFSWHENNGSQVFTRHEIAAGLEFLEVQAIDVDGNGATDIAMAARGGGLRWFQNNGSQAFTERVITTNGNLSYQSIFGADLDADGDIDFAATNQAEAPGEPGNVEWFENNGSETFTKHAIGAAARADSAFVADLDGDGLPDILAAAYENKVRWYRNNGNGTFSIRAVRDPQQGVVNGTYGAFAADIDSDGAMDAVWAFADEDMIGWFQNLTGLDFDFGDSPLPYPVTLAENGARHVPAGPYLGDRRDTEPDGVHSGPDPENPLEDDLSDDGIHRLTFHSGGTVGSFHIISNAGGKLDAWVDFNEDGDWLDSGEQIFASFSLPVGTRDLTFSSPTALVEGFRYARFRISSAGGLSPTGEAPNGEVEDFAFGITPPRPILVGPSGSVPTLRPTLTWNASVGAEEYDVFLGKYFENLVRIATVVGTSFTPATDLDIGGYNYAVSAVGPLSQRSSLSYSFFEIRVPVTGLQVAPTPSEVRPTLSWTALPGADHYDVWIDNLTTNQSQFIRNQNVLTNTFTPASDLPFGDYRAYVRAFPKRGQQGPWSAALNFSVLQLAAPVVTQGQNSTFDRTPTFAWDAVEDAAKYDVVIRSLKNGRTVVEQRNIVGTSWTPTTPFADGPYAWWVSALTAANVRGVWTNQMNINIGGQTTVLTPIGSSRNTTPTFSWKPVDGAVRYELWVDRQNPWVQEAVYQTNLVTTSFTSSGLPAGTYRSWVRTVSATNENSAWSIPVDFTILQLPAPVVTQGQNSTFDRTPTFAWDAVSGAAKYDVVVRSLKNGATVVAERNITGTSWTPTTPFADGPYAWWVSALTAEGVRGVWTDQMDIYIGGRTDVLAPIGSISDTTPTFSWKPVDGAVRYELWVDRQNPWVQKSVYQTNLTGTTFTSSTLPAGTYRTWVRAVSATNEFSPWSLPVDFTITDTAAAADTLLVNRSADERLSGVLERLLDPGDSVRSFPQGDAYSEIPDQTAVNVAESQPAQTEPAPAARPLVSADQSIDEFIVQWMMNPIAEC